MPIHLLSQSLINKIAAGEVIERPASVVKELMENAVDAGASRIDVAIAGGGVESIRVVDNGCGIAADELTLAVASHATSKLAEADDLFRVRTLGFRGEALASIAEVSRLVLRSRTAASDSATQIEVNGGEAKPVAPCGGPVGTTVEVHNLFFNTPVRRKFLRSVQTELGHVSEAFTRIALASPQIHFTLQHNGRPVFELGAAQEMGTGSEPMQEGGGRSGRGEGPVPISSGLLERISRLFGRDLAENLIWVESAQGEVRLSGYVAHPSHSRSNNRTQYLFLNGRYIRDPALQHALAEAYRGLLTVGRYPITFLMLQMPPDQVDVNVHPTKLEVRFQDSGRLYSQLLSTLRSKFLTTDLTTYVQQSPSAASPSAGHDEAQAAQLRQELVDWAKGKVSSWEPQRATGEHGPASASDPSGGGGWSGNRRPLELTRLDRPWGPPPQPQAAEASSDEPSSEPAPSGRSVRALQVHNRYLVTETEDGVTIIDQHALHERILYEQLRERVEAGRLETQNLLVPEPVDLGPVEAAAAVEHRELLARLGLKIEPFGGGTVLIAGYPAMLANLSPREVLQELLSRLLAGGKQPDRRDMLDDLLHTVACKAAIKAGDRLAPEEIASLLEQRHLVSDAHHCPHGRPASLVFTREELDKHFKRI